MHHIQETTVTTPFEKRLRRQVSGRLRHYFIATPMGYEDACISELQAILPQVEIIAKIQGGVEFKGRLADAYAANLHLRTANRILMRIDEFTVTNHDQLEHRLKKIPWELFLPPGANPLVRVQTIHSRLYHKAAIAIRIRVSIESVFYRLGIPQSAPDPTRPAQTIFTRVVDDRLTLSIDTSGELLYQRGIKTQGGKAPIRETTAAYALQSAGYDGQVPLLDPMCGSGTFSLEAAMIATQTAPGFFRPFAFMDWPSFNPKQWQYLLNQAQKKVQPSPTPRIFAADIDSVVCRRLQTALASHPILASLIQVQPLNFFEFSPARITEQTGIVAINPPYGLRIGDESAALQLFARIAQHLARHYAGWTVILIAPNNAAVSTIPFPWQGQVILHGGKRRFLIIGKVAKNGVIS